MRCLWTCPLVLCWLTCVPDGVALGQLVRIGPQGTVRVRAPFVRVDVGPGGRTSVRAPFTAVDASGRRDVAYRRRLDTRVSGRESAERGRQPTLADPALADWAALWRMLHSETIRLEEQLGQNAVAGGWKEYLQTAWLRELSANRDNRPPDPQTAGQLRDTLLHYQRTIATRSYRPISSLPSFRMVHAGLKELVSPPLQRERRQLGESARNLEGELRRLDSGRRWVRHLQLPEQIFVSRSGTEHSVPPPPDTDPDRERELGELIESLARFDAVSHDPKYRMIAGMPAFQTTHQRLVSYARHLSATLSDDPLRPPQIEVLPVPQPD